MNLKKLIIKNTFFSGLSTILIGLIGFFLLPFMINKVGAVEYGLVGMANIFAFSGYVSLLEMGFQSSISKYIAQYHAIKDEEKICRIINTAFLMFFLIGTVLAICFFNISSLLTHYLKITDNYTDSFTLAINCIFISYIYQFPTIVLAGTVEGLQRFEILKGIQVLCTLSMAISVIVCLILGYGYVSIILSILASFCLQFILLYISVIRLLPFFKIRSEYFSLSSLAEIWTLSKYIFIGKFSSLFYHQTPKILISIFLGPVAMTSYEIIMRLPRLLKSMLGFMNAAIMPAASVLKATDDKEKLRKLFVRGMRFQILFPFPIIFIAIIFSQEFLIVWVGQEFGHLYNLLQLSLVWNLAIPLVSFGGSILVGMNCRMKKMTVLSVVLTLISVLAQLIMVQFFGLEGIVSSLVLSYILLCPFFFHIYITELSINYLSMAKEIAIAVLLGIAIIIILHFFKITVIPVNIIWLCLECSIWLIIYFIGLYFFLLKKEDRALLVNLLTKKLHFT